jgi:hypothetical protein
MPIRGIVVIQAGLDADSLLLAGRVAVIDAPYFLAGGKRILGLGSRLVGQRLKNASRLQVKQLILNQLIVGIVRAGAYAARARAGAGRRWRIGIGWRGIAWAALIGGDVGMVGRHPGNGFAVGPRISSHRPRLRRRGPHNRAPDLKRVGPGDLQRNRGRRAAARRRKQEVEHGHIVIRLALVVEILSGLGDTGALSRSRGGDGMDVDNGFI